MEESYFRANEMYLDSAFGGRREMSIEDTQLGALLQLWAMESCETPFEAGCYQWEQRQLTKQDRHVADTWSWAVLPSVMYCSEDCVHYSIVVHKTEVLGIPVLECDACHAAEGEFKVTTLAGVMVVMVACAECCGFPEAKADLN